MSWSRTSRPIGRLYGPRWDRRSRISTLSTSGCLGGRWWAAGEWRGRLPGRRGGVRQRLSPRERFCGGLHFIFRHAPLARNNLRFAPPPVSTALPGAPPRAPPGVRRPYGVPPRAPPAARSPMRMRAPSPLPGVGAFAEGGAFPAPRGGCRYAGRRPISPGSGCLCGRGRLPVPAGRVPLRTRAPYQGRGELREQPATGRWSGDIAVGAGPAGPARHRRGLSRSSSPRLRPGVPPAPPKKHGAVLRKGSPCPGKAGRRPAQGCPDSREKGARP